MANLEHCEASVEGVSVVSVRFAVAHGEVMELAPLWRLLGAQARRPQRAQQQKKRTSSSHICSHPTHTRFTLATDHVRKAGNPPHEPRPQFTAARSEFNYYTNYTSCAYMTLYKSQPLNPFQSTAVPSLPVLPQKPHPALLSHRPLICLVPGPFLMPHKVPFSPSSPPPPSPHCLQTAVCGNSATLKPESLHCP